MVHANENSYKSGNVILSDGAGQAGRIPPKKKEKEKRIDDKTKSYIS